MQKEENHPILSFANISKWFYFFICIKSVIIRTKMKGTMFSWYRGDTVWNWGTIASPLERSRSFSSSLFCFTGFWRWQISEPNIHYLIQNQIVSENCHYIQGWVHETYVWYLNLHLMSDNLLFLPLKYSLLFSY